MDSRAESVNTAVNTIVRDMSPESTGSSHPTTHLDIRLASTPPSHSPLMHPTMTNPHVPPLEHSHVQMAFPYNYPQGMIPMDAQTYSMYNQQMWMMQQQRQMAMGPVNGASHQMGINPQAGLPMGYYSNAVLEPYPNSNYAASTSAHSGYDDAQYDTSSSAMSSKPVKPKKKVKKVSVKHGNFDDSESDYSPEFDASPPKKVTRPLRSKKSSTPPEDTLVTVKDDEYEDDEVTPLPSSSESEATTPKPKKKKKNSAPATPAPVPSVNTPIKTHLTPGGVLKGKIGNQTVYVCDVCSKTFKQNGHMRRHRRLHEGDESKTHVCPIEGCDAKYYRRDHLRRHFDAHWNTYVKNNNGATPKLVENATVQRESD